ncbi:MAG: UDP-GlcNAc:undecaprenyl-phosphate GlcNAc-1-phosphate transferase [Cognaticolwellia sp.]
MNKSIYNYNCCLNCLLLCFYCNKVFKPIAIDVGLVGKPNARKHNNGQVPIIGAISIFAAVFTSFFVNLLAKIERVWLQAGGARI